MSRACFNVLHVPLRYAIRQYGLTRDELYDILDEYTNSDEYLAPRYIKHFLTASDKDK